ncbi:MAG: tRNA (adenosine(37)-N6)-threonylcarbamoyltransferase complex ATPase subunit type 1 TsaE [Desulfovermiculus sp.]
MHKTLFDLECTARLGRLLAFGLISQGCCPILISGALGAGKTTLIRYIVTNLPGGDQAEVSSPSFNLINVYPTQPEVAHMDLYRLGQAGLDDSLIEYLETEDMALLVEWAEYVPQDALPANFIRMQIHVTDQDRVAELTAYGSRANAWLEHMKAS